jgi:quercetin 2,3-dioxygenase
MITVRKASERGHFNHGWLDTYHTFSFAEYVDPRFMGFRSLRVLNEDRVEAGAGFPTHSHRDMEIITYVLEGAVEHKDSLGNAGIIRPGEVQRMSAGTGVTHSEFNPSKKDSLHLLQIWILPEKKGANPGYEQRSFSKRPGGRFTLVASPNGEEGSVTIHQDARLWTVSLEKGQRAEFALDRARHAWIQVARGQVALNGHKLDSSDGAAVSSERCLEFFTDEHAEILLFDLA